MNPEFKKIVSDFVTDIATVFPEHGEACAAVHGMDTAAVFDHCKRTYAPQFFNILYRNDTVLFAEPIELLPGLNFKALWETPDVSDATKEAIWKYLQLVMFSVVSDLSDTSTFGDAAKLFEAIDESVLKSKLGEVMQQMQDMFKEEGGDAATNKQQPARQIYIVINKNQVDESQLFAKNVKVVVKDFMIMDISPKK